MACVRVVLHGLQGTFSLFSLVVGWLAAGKGGQGPVPLLHLSALVRGSTGTLVLTTPPCAAQGSVVITCGANVCTLWRLSLSS